MNKFKIIFSKKMLQGIPDLFLKYIPLYIYTSIRKNPKHLWLITERSEDARDNGFFLFKWIRDNHPDIKVFYAINKTSKDYNKISSLNNVVQWGSWTHYYYYLSSSLLCSTDFGLCAPNSRTIKAVRHLLPAKGKKVFLQHGITKDNLRHAYKDKTGVSLFVCGAYPEYEYIAKTFGYNNGEVKYLGFARYDNLYNTNVKKQILYMPTWRFWLREYGGFEKSDYYSSLCEFLSSTKLKEILEKYDTELIFFLHPAIREKKHMFMQFKACHIKILNNDDIDLQQLLKSCSMLITDYSSIYFDVAYLNKPVVYYQFDVEQYRKHQYEEGYFNYERDGFGPVVKTIDDLFNEIEQLIIHDFVNPQEYTNRIQRFFPLRDNNNCLRHFNELCKLDGLCQN